MKIRYEGVVLEVDPRDWYQRTLLRRRAKRAIDAYPGAGSGFVYHRRLNSVKSAHFAAAAIGRARAHPRRRTRSGTSWLWSSSRCPVPCGDPMSGPELSPVYQRARAR